jgi:hypothetical protein
MKPSDDGLQRASTQPVTLFIEFVTGLLVDVFRSQSIGTQFVICLSISYLCCPGAPDSRDGNAPHPGGFGGGVVGSASLILLRRPLISSEDWPRRQALSTKLVIEPDTESSTELRKSRSVVQVKSGREIFWLLISVCTSRSTAGWSISLSSCGGRSNSVPGSVRGFRNSVRIRHTPHGFCFNRARFMVASETGRWLRISG